jgi:hypothetical protein
VAFPSGNIGNDSPMDEACRDNAENCAALALRSHRP